MFLFNGEVLRFGILNWDSSSLHFLNRDRMRFLRIVLLLLFSYQTLCGQAFPATDYPKGMFRNPLDIPISLAANFGELRANHYHMGLDIRTAHRENLPVYAAADGYVDRIVVEPFGFGQAIYVRHPGGFYTVYGHINQFYPELSDYIRQVQYRREEWGVALTLPPDQFPVKKGDIIAYSGNRGGSQGPHLHFEIRTAPADVNLNPLLFGLPVTDHTPPVFRRLALYNRAVSMYEQSPQVIAVKRKGAQYSTLPVQVHFPAIGFGINGFDTQSGSVNPNGIYQAELYDNGVAVSAFRMNEISYAETRGINAHIDYRTWSIGGAYYQLLFRMPGYEKSIYSQRGTAVIRLDDRKPHVIRILAKDQNGNTAILETRVQYVPPDKPAPVVEGKMAYPGISFSLDSADGGFATGARTLYDSVHLTYGISTVTTPMVVSRLHRIGSTQIAVADSVRVHIRLTAAVTNHAQVLMQRFDAEGAELKRVQWNGDVATAAFRYFGNFQLIRDTIPPVIRFPGVAENGNLQNARRLLVTASDNLKVIHSFRATLDGKWLMFSNDKGRVFQYDFDEHCPAGNHELIVLVEDEAGNRAAASLHFTR